MALIGILVVILIVVIHLFHVQCSYERGVDQSDYTPCPLCSCQSNQAESKANGNLPPCRGSILENMPRM